jgi:hypothetical protein
MHRINELSPGILILAGAIILACFLGVIRGFRILLPLILRSVGHTRGRDQRADFDVAVVAAYTEQRVGGGPRLAEVPLGTIALSDLAPDRRVRGLLVQAMRAADPGCHIVQLNAAEALLVRKELRSALTHIFALLLLAKLHSAPVMPSRWIIALIVEPSEDPAGRTCSIILTTRHHLIKRTQAVPFDRQSSVRMLTLDQIDRAIEDQQEGAVLLVHDL